MEQNPELHNISPELIKKVRDAFTPLDNTSDYTVEKLANADKPTFPQLVDSLTIKLSQVSAEKVEPVITTLLNYRDHLISHWNEAGVLENAERFRDLLYQTPEIACGYLNKLADMGINTEASKKLIGNTTGMAIGPILDIRKEITDKDFDYSLFILPPGTFNRTDCIKPAAKPALETAKTLIC